MCDQQRLRPACAYAQSDQSLCLSLEYSMSVKLLTKHNLELPSLKGGFTVSSEYTHVKIPHCWKSHFMAHLCYTFLRCVSSWTRGLHFNFIVFIFIPSLCIASSEDSSEHVCICACSPETSFLDSAILPISFTV